MRWENNRGVSGREALRNERVSIVLAEGATRTLLNLENRELHMMPGCPLNLWNPENKVNGVISKAVRL